jgi:hypothetical protein
MVTECCGVRIARDWRFCPKCGHEARCRPAVAPRCPKCRHDMTWTATLPVFNSPMEWKCFNCRDLGFTAQANIHNRL